MNQRRTLTPARLCVVVSVLMLPSCAQTTNPLSDPLKAKADDRLVGVWRLIPNDKAELEYMFLFIGNSDDPEALPGMMKAVEVSSDKSSRPRTPGPVFFLVTSLAGQQYASLLHGETSAAIKLLKTDPENAKPWSVLKYGVEPNRLTIWLIDDKAASDAVRKGQVKGRIERNGLLTIVSMTGGDDLAGFLSNGGDRTLFNDQHKLEFARVQ
jgi:hypothetical protein